MGMTQAFFRYEVVVVKVLVHEDFIFGQAGHDIALIKLSKAVNEAFVII